jgi:LysM repeat protein
MIVMRKINNHEQNRTEKRIRFIMAIILLIGIIQIVLPLMTSANTPTTYITLIVEEGDSLWEIAQRYKNDNIDIRQYISIIRKHNQKQEALLQPGEVLEIPVY